MVVHVIMAMIQYYNIQYFSKQVLSQFKVLKLKIYPCSMIYISYSCTAVG